MGSSLAGVPRGDSTAERGAIHPSASCRFRALSPRLSPYLNGCARKLLSISVSQIQCSSIPVSRSQQKGHPSGCPFLLRVRNGFFYKSADPNPAFNCSINVTEGIAISLSIHFNSILCIPPTLYARKYGNWCAKASATSFVLIYSKI